MLDDEESNETKLSVEECKSLYFDDKALMEPSRTMYRLSGHSGGRYYYSYDEDGEIQFYISVTNKIEKTMPTSPYLIDWIASMGRKEAREYSKMRADYGTLMHIKFSQLLIQKEINLDDELSEQVEGYLKESKQPLDLHESWLTELRKDILAFARFCHEFKVKPLAIEVVLGSDKNGDAGAVDLLCEMIDPDVLYKTGSNKGKLKKNIEEKYITAIVDFKSGKNGFYEQHEIQLADYKELVIENFSQFEDEDIRLFNFAPTDWRTSPNYKLKDQTNSPNIEKLKHIHELGKIELSKRKETALIIEGDVKLNSGPDSLEDNYKHVMIANLIKEGQHERKD